MTYYLFKAAGSYYLYPSLAGYMIFYRSVGGGPWAQAVNLSESDHERFQDLCKLWNANPFNVIRLTPEQVREMTFVDML